VEILVLLVFMSLAFVAAALVLFVWTVRQRTLEHADGLSLLPLEPDRTDHDRR
jgi:nitrogen fixation-related uncharacterized protein